MPADGGKLRASPAGAGAPGGERRVTMPIFHYVVLTDAKPGRRDEFEDWYDQQHLKDVVAVPGVRSAKRYRLISKITEQVEPAPWCSLAIYEIDADDPVEATRKLSALARTAAMPVSDALEWDTRLKIIGELVSEISAPDGRAR
jgi:hypothetical protein